MKEQIYRFETMIKKQLDVKTVILQDQTILVFYSDPYKSKHRNKPPRLLQNELNDDADRFKLFGRI